MGPHINYARNFIDGYAEMVKALYNIGGNATMKLVWSEELENTSFRTTSYRLSIMKFLLTQMHPTKAVSYFVTWNSTWQKGCGLSIRFL